MSQPTGDPQSGTTGEPQSGTGTGDPATGTATGTTDPQSGTPAVPKTYTEAEFIALQARMAAADRNNAAAQQKLKEIEQAQMTEQQRKDAELKDAKEQLAALKVANQERALENAFLSDNTYTWHNPGAALRLLERDGVEVADDGTVKGMKVALDNLAKQHPYLLKTADAAEPDDKGKGGATGVPGTARPQGGQTGRAKLEEKWPAMRGRVAQT